MYDPARLLADLLLESNAADPRQRVRIMFGKITGIGAANLRVRPDSMASGDIGPLWKNSLFTPAVNDRVLCLWDPEGKSWVVVMKVVNQP